MSEFAAVVLAGGAARRFGGIDKMQLRVGGRTLVDRVLEAVADAAPVVVVGPSRPVSVPVLWTRETPPGSGPLAGLAAGLALVPESAELVAVLAGDLPLLSHRTVARMRAALLGSRAAGAVLVDPAGYPQWLTGVWRAGELRRALPEDVRDRSVRSVLGELGPLRIPASPREAADVDTPQDLSRIQRYG
ncbi:molybdenum cofactor guanylyltransferase [Saccharopolyspora rectivirgula]|uniref:Molybdopterin-guanine dinucleotide biosynthesis protein MobA n=1 Tax=Saccharopolyspora rectivirgula TaxID=28042 RepID=A0A073AXW0_9PSEU|nr:NTP transferase domain-containing protein [Saccharopolyspora rectivirgula]KEI43912.1 molybdopterin-guanine dinucleotide biosynthesis protein MobA [Saccharopolyspora rectivirgula]